MRQKSVNQKPSSERIVKDIRRATRKQYSAEEKIRIVLDGLRGEHSIAPVQIRHRSKRRDLQNAQNGNYCCGRRFSRRDHH
jgi:transposase-like protein